MTSGTTWKTKYLKKVCDGDKRQVASTCVLHHGLDLLVMLLLFVLQLMKERSQAAGRCCNVVLGVEGS